MLLHRQGNATYLLVKCGALETERVDDVVDSDSTILGLFISTFGRGVTTYAKRNVQTLFFLLFDRAIHRLTNVDFTFLDGDHLSINFEDDVIDQVPDNKVTQGAKH